MVGPLQLLLQQLAASAQSLIGRHFGQFLHRRILGRFDFPLAASRLACASARAFGNRKLLVCSASRRASSRIARVSGVRGVQLLLVIGQQLLGVVVRLLRGGNIVSDVMFALFQARGDRPPRKLAEMITSRRKTIAVKIARSVFTSPGSSLAPLCPSP